MCEYCGIELHTTMASKDYGRRAVALQLSQAGWSQKDIAERLGCEEATISKWAKDEDWQTRKNAIRVTPQEIANKNLLAIGMLLDFLERISVSESTVVTYSKVVDQITKLASVVEKINKEKSSVVTAIDAFDDFSAWLEGYAEKVRGVTDRDIDKINGLLDTYIQEKIKNKE
jgi:transcriptional regulator with XRE-family HTH domain